MRTTLARMADGGIHDQLGGGFCRYSVDAEWSIPHFEKMLYDNGPLLGLYADTARSSGDARFGEVARGIAGWLQREMRAPDGAFYASLDADSDGAEGRFYVWKPRRSARADDGRAMGGRRAVLRPRPAAELRRACVAPARGRRRSRRSPPTSGSPLPVAQSRLAAARAALTRARESRVRPGRDDKVLTAWNALAIGGLARAARALDDRRYAEQAATALDGLLHTAWRDGRLHATRDGDAPGPARAISTITRSCCRRSSS